MQSRETSAIANDCYKIHQNQLNRLTKHFFGVILNLSQLKNPKWSGFREVRGGGSRVNGIGAQRIGIQRPGHRFSRKTNEGDRNDISEENCSGGHRRPVRIQLGGLRGFVVLIKRHQP
ncbi:hypothetical protein [Bifidobacterium tsurumiense]|uniref:hypothetical protein n=1 Tax=Bifidobacterium tsurumiense TaxID=356829 RepID=UPI0013635E6A|nr:hypothetical protein [Bifidobacterium tsurumiense]